MIFDDLVAEQDRLETILDELDDAAWVSPSGAAGWTIADVVLHLAQTEEAVVASARGENLGSRCPTTASGDDSSTTLMDRNVRARTAPRRRGLRAVADARGGPRSPALRDADPAQRLPWAAAPLKPTTLATTRLAEHWAHGLDITGPLDIPFPDTDRLRHIAWLAHGSLPYAFTLVGEEPARRVLRARPRPTATTWQYGSPEADSTITGSAGAFCRVGAQPARAGGLGTRHDRSARTRRAPRPAQLRGLNARATPGAWQTASTLLPSGSRTNAP